MFRLNRTSVTVWIAAVVVITGLSYVLTGAAEPPPFAELKAQSAKAIRGATPYAEIKDEPAPKLIVDPPIPDLLAQGVVWIQWRVENVRILPVFGKGALNVSPRVGQLTYTLTTCLGGGRTRAITTRSTWPAGRRVSTRC